MAISSIEEQKKRQRADMATPFDYSKADPVKTNPVKDQNIGYGLDEAYKNVKKPIKDQNIGYGLDEAYKNVKKPSTKASMPVTQPIAMTPQERSDTGTVLNGSNEYLDNVFASADRKKEEEKQNFLGDIARVGQLSDRKQEDLQTDYDIGVNSINRQLEETRINTKNQISDIRTLAERNEQAGAQIGALTGRGRSGGFVKGLDTIIKDADKNVQRLEEKLSRIEASADEVKGELLADFEKKKQRFTEDLNYQFRDLMESTKISVNNLVDTYGLSSEKLEKQLAMIDFDIEEKKMNFLTKYQDNMKTAFDMANTQADRLTEQQDKIKQEMVTARTDFINSSGSRTINELQNLISSGKILEDDAKIIVSEMIQNAIDTLDTSFGDGLGLMYQQRIVEGIMAGKTPTQVLNEIVTGDDFGETIQQMAANDPLFYYKIQQAQQGLRQGELNILGQQQGLLPSGSLLPVDKETIAQTYGTTPAVRNFNPGNITDTSFGGQKVPGERFTVFNNPQEGFNALVQKIRYNQTNQNSIYFGDTLGEYFEKYAPSSDGNNPKAYAQAVANNLGVDVNTKIDQIDSIALAGEIARQEDGNSYRMLNDLGILGGGFSADIIDTATSILNGVGDYPSRTDPEYKEVQKAVGQIIEERKAQTDDPQLKYIYESAKYNKFPSDTTVTSLTDAFTVLTQVDNLTTTLENMEDDIGPIEGYLRGKNPWDVDTQAIASQLNALVPKVARGVFGEVGVLTDQDIERYMKTLPNNRMTGDLADVIGDLLKITVVKSFVNSITSQAKAGRNMSNFATDYTYATEYLESKGVSPNPWDNYAGESVTPIVTDDEIEQAADYLDDLGSEGW